MSSRLEVKDPVYAAFLISKGCKLVTIEPYRPPMSPKKYIFNGDVRDKGYNAEFLGAGGPGAKTSWLDFKNRLDNLQTKEERLFRNSSSRIEIDGKETWSGKNVFVTSCQATAAFLLSRGAVMYGAKEIRRMKYLFAFSNQEESYNLALEMLDGDAEATWYHMKEKHKQATAYRNHFCRKKSREAREAREELRASGTNG